MTSLSAIRDMSAEEYHLLPYANASSLKAIRKSVAHMLTPYERKSAFDLGTAIHTIVLEGSEAFIERHPVRPDRWDSWRSKDARAWRDEQEAEGRTVISKEERELAARLARNITNHASARALMELSEGNRELTYIWNDVEWDVTCKCRFDAIAIEGAQCIGIDLKSTRSAFHEDFAKDAVNYGYDLQVAHYAEGFRAIEGEELLAYTIIAVETQEPYGVAVYQMTEEWLERGAFQRELAMEAYAEWHKKGRLTDVAPYSPNIEPLALPRWA